jgi:hypothetical protein
MRIATALVLLASGVVSVATAYASGDADLDALTLADTANSTVSKPSHWRGAFELAAANYGVARQTREKTGNDTVRAGASISYDGALGSGWHAVFSNRIDMGWRGTASTIDTWKEGYVSWQPAQSIVVDAGRVNLREGVSSGFNPTDFFKANALRSIVSIDPASLRENRLGAVMLRAQMLWAGGSLNALVSPRLADRTSGAALSPDLGATNRQWRYMIGGTQRLFEGFAPQWLVYGGAGTSPQIGVNATALLDDATVAFVEYAGGRGQALADEPRAGERFHSRLSTGVTRTFPGKVSVTLEYDYDGLSADRSTWHALGSDPARYGAYREAVGRTQELTTRQSLFAYVTWEDAIVRHLDATAMGRYDLVDHSAFTWLEARYHWSRTDLAVQWQTDYGGPHTVYGAAEQAELLQAIVTFYF